MFTQADFDIFFSIKFQCYLNWQFWLSYVFVVFNQEFMVWISTKLDLLLSLFSMDCTKFCMSFDFFSEKNKNPILTTLFYPKLDCSSKLCFVSIFHSFSALEFCSLLQKILTERNINTQNYIFEILKLIYPFWSFWDGTKFL